MGALERKDLVINRKPLFSVAVADTFFLRLRGLLGRDVQELGGLLISPCNQIHTFWMGYAIDVVYLDEAGKVLRVDCAVPRGKCCKTERAAKMVLELPAGCTAKCGISLGDVIK